MKRKSNRSKGAKWTLRGICIFALLAVGLGVRSYLSKRMDPERVRSMAESFLQGLTKGEVSVGGASFSWWDGIRIFDVTVAEASRETDGTGVAYPPLTSEPFFSCREIELAHDPWALMAGRLVIRSVVAKEPTCLIVRNVGGEVTNLAGLFRPSSETVVSERMPQPILELRDARIKVVVRDDAESRVVEDLRLTIRALPSDKGSPSYDIVWHGGGDRVASGRSRFDVASGRFSNVSGGLPWLSVEAVMVAVNATSSQAETRSDLLGQLSRLQTASTGVGRPWNSETSRGLKPSARNRERGNALWLDGLVRVSDYDLTFGWQSDERQSVTIELDGASLSIPVDESEQRLASGERYLRFREVSGEVKIEGRGMRATFGAGFHGSRCRVEADFRQSGDTLRSLDDVAFEVRLQVTGLRLPERGSNAPPDQDRFVQRWDRLSRVYRSYDPHGLVDLEVVAGKEGGPDGKLTLLRMKLSARGCDASFRLFPYRVSELHGSIELDPSGILIRDLAGRHGDGVVEVNGWVEKPKKSAAAKLHVRGTGIPVDGALLAAIPHRFGEVAEKFRIAGRFDTDVLLERGRSADDDPLPWQPHMAIAANGLTACYEDFPYALTAFAGDIVIEPGQVQLDDVKATSGAGEVVVDGWSRFEKDREATYGVDVVATDVVTGSAFVAALPRDFQEPVRRFHPQGKLDIRSRIWRDHEEPGAVHETEVQLKGLELRYEPFPVAMADVTGTVVLDQTRMRLQDVVGSLGEATVVASGWVDLATMPPRVDIVIDGTNVLLNESLCDAAPDPLQSILRTWRVSGPVDVSTVLRGGSTEDHGSLTVLSTVRLDGASIGHPFLAEPVEEVRGEVSFCAHGARGKDLRARYGAASVSVDFDATYEEGREEGVISLDAVGVPLDDSIHAMLPKGLKSAWRRRSPGGTVDLHLAPLRYSKSDRQSPRVWEVDGYADLDGVRWQESGLMAAEAGRQSISGYLIDPDGGTALGGTLRVESGSLFDHQTSNLMSQWMFVRRSDGVGHLSLEGVEAEACGGRFVGGYDLTFDDASSSYRLSMTAFDLNASELVTGGDSIAFADEDASAIEGVVDIRLDLSGQTGRPLSKRGNGRVEVRDGSLYKLPVVTAIFNVINLRVPRREALDHARADFSINGNRIELQPVWLRSPSVQLKGTGTIALPGSALDLELTYVNPNSWMKVPALAELVEGVSRELAQLHVGGTLRRPSVTVRPFSRISREVKSLIKKRSKRPLRGEVSK